MFESLLLEYEKRVVFDMFPISQILENIQFIKNQTKSFLLLMMASTFPFQLVCESLARLYILTVKRCWEQQIFSGLKKKIENIGTKKALSNQKNCKKLESTSIVSKMDFLENKTVKEKEKKNPKIIFRKKFQKFLLRLQNLSKSSNFQISLLIFFSYYDVLS